MKKYTCKILNIIFTNTRNKREIVLYLPLVLEGLNSVGLACVCFDVHITI